LFKESIFTSKFKVVFAHKIIIHSVSGKIYFFKGKSFWKFNDMKMRVEHEKPMLSSPFWMGCPKRLEEPLTATNEKITSAAGRSRFWTPSVFAAILGAWFLL